VGIADVVRDRLPVGPAPFKQGGICDVFEPGHGAADCVPQPGQAAVTNQAACRTSAALGMAGRLLPGVAKDVFDKVERLEGSGFLLERRPVSFSAFSAGNTALGMPINLPVPFTFAGLPAGPTAFTNGNGAGIPETITIQSSSQLWDAEANAVYSLLTNDRVHVQLLGGFRYLDLAENLRLSAASTDAATGGEELIQDGFQTRNQFYGPQLGARAGVSYGRLFAELTALIAMGPDHETLSINGNSTVTNGAFGLPTGTFIGGVYAQPSNIGTFRRDVFSVIPEARLQFGYDVTRRLRATVGYDFLYVSDVLRPGNQIDATVNANQSGLFGTGTIQNPALPAPLLQRSDYWAQGITFGLEFRF
jgi:Putative beta barrel porin-7 (BBP7)